MLILKKNNVDGLIEAGDIIISCNDEEIIHNSDISKVYHSHKLVIN